MKNQVIEVLNAEHGKKVIEYWKSKGVHIKDLSGNYYKGLCTKEDDDGCRYYGIIDGRANNFTLDVVKKLHAEIITLPEEKTFPRKMLVWNGNENNAFETYVFIELSNKADFRYIGVSQFDIEEYEQGENYNIQFWNHAKELPEVNTKKQELLNKADELRNKLNEIEEQIKDL
jgi:hypothetical protein